MKVYEAEVKTKSFSCKGLVSPSANPYTPLISGVEDFQLQYGFYSPGAAAGSYNLRFVDADLIGSQGPITVNGEAIDPWRRVLAVRVCVVSKTFEMVSASVSASPSWTRCDGTTVAASDRAVRKTYTQTFGIKNHLNTVY
jgi:type IV pilus assembly protein PilW